MSGFWVWVASPGGTLALVSCGLVVGMILGYLTGHRMGWRAAVAEMRQRREEARAELWTKQLRAPWPPGTATGYLRGVTRTMAGTSIDPPYRSGAEDEAWEPVHVGQALQVANPPLIVQEDPESLAYWRSLGGDPITTGEIAAITPRMDAFLEELFRVPYSADELWSGQ